MTNDISKCHFSSVDSTIWNTLNTHFQRHEISCYILIVNFQKHRQSSQLLKLIRTSCYNYVKFCLAIVSSQEGDNANNASRKFLSIEFHFFNQYCKAFSSLANRAVWMTDIFIVKNMYKLLMSLDMLMAWVHFLSIYLFMNLPAAKMLSVGCAVSTQNLSCSLRNVFRQVRLDMSHTLMLLSSELLMISSCRGWNSTQETLL